MHPALSIPEILAQIFVCLDKKSNVATALVCKQWSDIALDEVWREARLDQFFQALAKLDSHVDSDGDEFQVR